MNDVDVRSHHSYHMLYEYKCNTINIKTFFLNESTNISTFILHSNNYYYFINNKEEEVLGGVVNNNNKVFFLLNYIIIK